MRYCILFFLLLMPISAWAQSATDPQASVDEKAELINNITIEGFVLGDKDQFIKLFKPYRQKHLTKTDMDGILQEIQHIYEEQGYLELVSISYQVVKHRLIYTVLMTS